MSYSGRVKELINGIPEGWALISLGDHQIYWNKAIIMNVETKYCVSGTGSTDEEALEQALTELKTVGEQ